MRLLLVNWLFRCKKKKKNNNFCYEETSLKNQYDSSCMDKKHFKVKLNKRSKKLYLNSNLQYLLDAISITLFSIYIQQ